MRMALDSRCGEQHAITDIYCAKRQRSLVAFPVALISLLILSGVGAFLLTGFVGYINCLYALAPGSAACWTDPWSAVLYLNKPWPLYLWASAVVLTVQVAILRDPSLRRRLVLALIATLASIAIVAIAYLFGDKILEWLRANYDRLLNIVQLPITYAIINFAIVAFYLLTSVIRWIRHPDGLKLIGIRSVPQRRKADTDTATLEELISGDLLTGMVLFFVLAQIFTRPFLEGFYKFTTLATYLSDKGNLPANITNVPVSLSTTDTVLALLCLFMGFMSLALTGLLAGLAVLQDQNSPAASQLAPRAANEVIVAVLNALRAAITRQLRGMVRQVGYTSRRALWPLLLLGASFCLALFGQFVQYYLHFFDPTYHCLPAYVAKNHLSSCLPQSHLLVLVEAIACGLGGVIGAILSTALQVRSWRVAVNAFGLLRWVGLVVLITFWIFSTSLFAFNLLLLQLGIAPGNLSVPAGVPSGGCSLPVWYNVAVPLGTSCTQPFIPLSYPTLISFVAFLIVVAILVVRLRQGVVRRAPSPSASTTARGLPVPRATTATTATTASATRGVRSGDAGR